MIRRLLVAVVAATTLLAAASKASACGGCGGCGYYPSPYNPSTYPQQPTVIVIYVTAPPTSGAGSGAATKPTETDPPELSKDEKDWIKDNQKYLPEDFDSSFKAMQPEHRKIVMDLSKKIRDAMK